MEIVPIAHFRSPFPTKFGIPRQAGLAGRLRGRVVFEPGFRSDDAVRGLEGFDYLWLIWGFSSNRHCRQPGGDEAPCRLVADGHGEDRAPFRATVRPPRLGGNGRMGVFASRSPFRPNPLGLSSVKIESIEYGSKGTDGRPLGPVINVLGADLMDGTPIYDIKPYVTYADSHPDARSGFVDSTGWKQLEVVFPAGVGVPGLDLEALREVLSQDPRPGYEDDPSRIHGMPFEGHDVRFKVGGGVLTVLEIVRDERLGVSFDEPF